MAKKILSLLITLIIIFLGTTTNAASQQINVFAASSLSNVISELAKDYQKEHHILVSVSFASSSALARQIYQGAPADIYLSANTKWMDYLIQKNQIKTHQILLKNSLVLIAPKDSKEKPFQMDQNWDILKVLNHQYLAIGEPSSVPVGIYAKESLISLGLWEQVSKQVAPTNNVRAVLALVERKEVPLGIVYKTDALISDRVKILAEFPSHSHSPILYPIGIVKNKTNKEVNGFYQFLQSEVAADVFKQYGFRVLSSSTTQ